MNFKKYWDFFSETNCRNVLNVEFFENGYFALLYANHIVIYSASCKHVKTLFHNEARYGYSILTNGMIVKIDEKELNVIAKDGVWLEKPYRVECSNFAKYCCGSLILTRSLQDTHQVILIPRNKEPEVLLDLGKDLFPCAFSASVDSEIFAIKSSTCGQLLFKGLNCVNPVIDIPRDCRLKSVMMMSSGSFIANCDDETCLFDKELNKLAISCKADGFSIKDGNFIIFEGKLLLDDKGNIIGEYPNDVKFISADRTLLFAYKIVNLQGVGYYLGGKLLNTSPSSYRLKKNISLIYSQGMIFPLSFELKKEDVIGEGIYFKRLREMLTH